MKYSKAFLEGLLMFSIREWKVLSLMVVFFLSDRLRSCSDFNSWWLNFYRLSVDVDNDEGKSFDFGGFSIRGCFEVFLKIL
jgi:hypothetical protein